MANRCLLQSKLGNLPARRGKVRDVYELAPDDPAGLLLLVATDRISAFDWVLPTGIADKGRVLTETSRFWFERLGSTIDAGVPHHLVTTDVAEMDLPEGVDRDALAGRTMLCRKSRVVPFECVVRGYLSGSGWKEYQRSGTVCGVSLPPGLVESDRLPEPIFTPATKAEQGDHDENVSFDRMLNDLGSDLAEELRERSLAIYLAGAEHAASKGILLADTKLEFGHDAATGELLLIDEVMTPDSSRYWPADIYEPGHGQPSFDKQFVRDWLLASDWDRESEPPPLPDDVVAKTRAKYIDAFERLTGAAFVCG
ncbi:MAG: phosphoribosylaminoimidazolesuccinocarboxamide synthase [Planctomycetota bacterium]